MSEKTEQISNAENRSKNTASAAVSDGKMKEASGQKTHRFAVFTKFVFRALFHLSGELTAVVLGISLAWLCAVNMLIAQRVADVSFFKADASRWFSNAFEGKSADVGDVTLMWEAANNTVVFRARDVSVKTENGKPLNALAYVETELALRDIVKGKLDPIRVEVDGGELSFLRDAEGNFIAGLGTPETVGQFGPVWRGEKNDGDNDLEIGRIKSLKIENAKIYVKDSGLDYSAEMNNSNFYVDFVPDGVVFDMKADVSVDQGDEVSALKFKGRVSPDLQNIDATFSALKLNPSKVLPRLNILGPIIDLNAPLDLTLHSLAGRGSGLAALDLDILAGAGTLERDGQNTAFDMANIKGAYNPSSQTLEFKKFVLKSDLISTDGEVLLSNLGSPSEGLFSKDTRFKLKLKTADWNGDAMKIAPLSLSDVRVEGQVVRDNNKVIFDVISGDFDGFKPRLRGSLTRDESGTPIAASFRGGIDGSVSRDQLLSLWPRTIIRGARRWIENSVVKASLTNLYFRFDADEAVLAGQPLKDEDLTLTFDLSDGDVNYISTMTPLTDVSGQGVVLGNQVEFTLHQGRIADVELSAGKVNIPRIYPYGGDLIIEGQGTGPVNTLIGLLDQKPFEYVTPYGVNPDEFSGLGTVELSVTRPLRQNITFDQVDFEVTGQLVDVSAPFAVGKNALTNGAVNVLANREGMSVKGPVNIGPWQANLNWREVFDNGVTPSRYKVEGRVNQSDLDSFGIGLREFIGGGDIKLSIDAQADGLAITSAQLVADLKDTDMRIGPYWSKSKGVDGLMTGELSFTKDQQVSLKKAKVLSPGLLLEGSLDMGADYKLQELNFTRAKIAGFIDAAAQVKPSPDQSRFDAYLTGQFLDVSPFVSGTLGGTKNAIDVPVLLKGAIVNLALSESYVVQDTDFLFAHNGVGITQARLQGRKGEGDFRIDLNTDDVNNIRSLDVDVPEMTDAALAFFNMQSFQGGRLQVNADLPAVGTDGPLTGTAKLEDLVVIDAPIMTTMLSLASLKGLVEALEGRGLKFNNLEAPFSYSGGRLSIRNARAAGAGLGMTGNGEIDFNLKALDLDGVLVPAYTANSLLESVPIIGDIFVGKKGEGIFALNYTVQGLFSEAQVAVNPLSALTPGFLRGIFATQRDDLPDQLKDQIESVRPKAAPDDKAE